MSAPKELRLKLDKGLADYAKAGQKQIGAAAAQQKARQRVQALTQQVQSPELLQLISNHLRACDECVAPAVTTPSTPFPQLFQRNAQHAMVRSAEALYLLAVALQRVPAWFDPVDSAVTPQCLDAAVKAKLLSKKDIEERALSDTNKVYHTAIADWFCKRAPAKQLTSLAMMALSRRPRPDFLPAWNELARVAVARDKAGAIIQSVLAKSPDDQPVVSAIVSAYMLDTRTSLRLADLTFKALQDKKRAASARTLCCGIADQAQSKQPTNASLCAARVVSGLLLSGPLPPPAQEAAAPLIGFAAQAIGIAMHADPSSPPVWLLTQYPSSGTPAPAGALITHEAAQRLAVALKQAGKGLDAVAVVSALAQNLGLTPLGAKGETTSFNPVQHEDTDGGLIRGDECEITAPGWCLGQEVITRALARRRGHAHA